MKIYRHLVVFFLISFFSIPLATAQSNTIINLEGVKAAQQRGAIILDVRSTKEYLQGHIPGAISIGDLGTVLLHPNREDYIDLVEITAIFNQAGLDVQKEIIAYGARGNPYAYFGLFTIQYFGGKQAKVFHDGIDVGSRQVCPLRKLPLP